MADQPINSGASSLGSSGADVLLRFLSDQVVQASRNWGGVLRHISDVSGAVAQKGNIVGVYVSPNIASRTMTDGAAKVLDDDTGTTTNVTLNRLRYSAFSKTTVARALEGDFTTAAQIQSRVYALLNDIESDVLSTATASFTTNTATGTYNTAITEAVISESVETLLDQRPPSGVPLIGMVRSGTTSWGAIAQLANFVQVQVTGESKAPTVDEAYGQGRLWHNTRWYMTQAMPKTGTSTDNLILHPQALSMAMRIPGDSISSNSPAITTVVDPLSGIAFQIIMQWDPARMADEIVVRALYGYSVVKNAWGIQLKS